MTDVDAVAAARADVTGSTRSDAMESTRADATAFTRVLVVAPRTRVDVALPADVPVVDLMPLLLEMVGERQEDGDAEPSGWVLAPVGGQRLDPGRSLRSLDVLDGTSLQLSARPSPVADPVYDDVVDAIATAVRERTDARSLRELAGALAGGAGLLLAAYVLLVGEHTAVAAGLAGVVAVVALAGSAGLVRAGASRMLAVVLAGCGAPAALVAGVLAVPGEIGFAGALLGSTAVLAYAVLAGLLLATGTVVFSAITVVSVFGVLASLGGLLFDASAAQAATVVSAMALATLSMLPWLAVRLSRLPVPVIPTTPDELRDSALGVDFADAGRRAAVAAEYLDGSLVGCALVASTGAALSLAQGSTMPVLYAAAVIASLLLRVRSVTGMLPRAVLLVVGIAGAGVGVALSAGEAPEGSTLGIVALCLVVSAVAVLVAAVQPRRRLSPTTGRSIDIFEGFLLVAVLPLAIGAAGLYSAVRHW